MLDILKVLADEVRLRILRSVDQAELSVAEIVDALEIPQSTVSRHLKPLKEINLISARREGTSVYYSSGDLFRDEDFKHIGENQYITKPEVKLLRDSGLIDSYIFEVVFTGKTQNIRSFINQLRPPYSLRSIKVERPSVVDNQTGTNFFEDTQNSGQKDILPIIRDITSTFTIIVEYVFAVPGDLITQIQEDLSEGFERNELEVVLQEFK